MQTEEYEAKVWVSRMTLNKRSAKRKVRMEMQMGVAAMMLCEFEWGSRVGGQEWLWFAVEMSVRPSSGATWHDFDSFQRPTEVLFPTTRCGDMARKKVGDLRFRVGVFGQQTAGDAPVQAQRVVTVVPWFGTGPSDI